jgi:hypothetical protein
LLLSGPPVLSLHAVGALPTCLMGTTPFFAISRSPWAGQSLLFHSKHFPASFPLRREHQADASGTSHDGAFEPSTSRLFRFAVSRSASLQVAPRRSSGSIFHYKYRFLFRIQILTKSNLQQVLSILSRILQTAHRNRSTKQRTLGRHFQLNSAI